MTERRPHDGIGARPECKTRPQCVDSRGFPVYCPCLEIEAATMARAAQAFGELTAEAKAP
jgi:hypothetical protein